MKCLLHIYYFELDLCLGRLKQGSTQMLSDTSADPAFQALSTQTSVEHHLLSTPDLTPDVALRMSARSHWCRDTCT